MKLITYLTICFIAYEFLKLCMLETYWNATTKSLKNFWMVIVEVIYMIFLIVLIFVGYWYVGASVFIISLITAFRIMDDVMEKVKFNKKIRNDLLADGVVSILMLAVLLLKEFQVI
jgi:hypothetical protein